MKVDLKVKNITRYIIKEKALQSKERKKLDEELREETKKIKEKIIKLKSLYATSRNKLARKLKINSGYISQLMSGQRNPSPKLREKIMELMPEYTWDDLFKIKGGSGR